MLSATGAAVLTPLNEPRTVRTLPLYDYGPHPRRRRSPWRRSLLAVALAAAGLLAVIAVVPPPGS